MSVTASTAHSSDLALAFSARTIISKHAPLGKSADRTLRINLFSNSVTETQLVEWLEGLACDEPDGHSSPNESNILKLTLYPYRTWQVATVTFCSVPLRFALCAPGRGQEARVKIGETEAIDISVDCDFWGLTPLYTAQVPSVDIVAVPGLGAHAFGTWKSSNGYRMWLRDFLPSDIQGLRILLYGYDSALQGSTNTSSIQQYGRQLLDAVNNSRAEQEKHRPLIFIGHSLGGLVIKQALADAKQGSENDCAILNSCAALLFFGVPNRGLNNNNMLSLVKGQKNEHLVNDLREGSSLLDLSYQSFLQNVGPGYCRVVSFYETKDTRVIQLSTDGRMEKTGPYVRLVTKESATWATPNEALYDQVPINADHSAMVKFANRADGNYLSAIERLRECVNIAPNIIRQRLESFSGCM
ncbi:hypothetical protein BDD12DRAFT_730767 [Trichophaea hybrida]|nr:hypothetical protein BDD12DRAFT_730767 [Trichophaea hybrida]